tara:strand:- start:289 stop:585 length:297 start_codon:yes stop_codon:yes gene_type:complete
VVDLVESVTQVVVILHRMVDLVDQVVVVLKSMEPQDQVHQDKVVMVEQDQDLLDLLRTLVGEVVVLVAPVVMRQEMPLEEWVVLVFNFPQYSKTLHRV